MDRSRPLRWDPGNVSHIARHGVTSREVAEVYSGRFVFGSGAGGRITIIGTTAVGRILAIVLDPYASSHYYPVTARPASRSERRRYRDTMEAEG